MLKDFDFDKVDDRYDNFKRSELGEELDQTHRILKRLNIPVLIMVDGWGASGKGTALNDLTRELDPHDVRVEVFDEATDVEKAHPTVWRYWQRIPNNQELVVYDQSFYHAVFSSSHHGDEFFSKRIKELMDLEETLMHNGMIVIKFFLNISKETQAKRIKKLEKMSYPKARLSQSDYDEQEHYEECQDWMDRILEATNTAYSPWLILNAEDPKHASKRMLGLTLNQIQSGVERITAAREHDESPVRRYTQEETVLDKLDMTKSISEEDYNDQLEDLQKEAADLVFDCFVLKIPIVVLFEGNDAAGKDGAIKRLTRYIDPRSYQIHNIAAPNDEEKSHHYLWRFERTLPADGDMAVYSRSWYGRVLVERVDQLTPEREWEQAYEEINEFEQTLTGHKMVLLKYFLAIDKDEQKRRFEERMDDPKKQYKITPDDWHNRSKWEDYTKADEEMFARTSTDNAPWTIIPANDKHYARITVLQTFNARLKDRIQEEKDK